MISYLFQQPFIFLAWTVAFLLALSIHEFSHALASTYLGDSTAKRMGRLTLNPMAHIDLIGFLAVFLIGFGWGKPVPYNPYNLKWQKWGPTMVAAAGPFSNLFLAALSIFLLVILAPKLGPNNLLVVFLYISSQLNIALMVFNLIPLPPLDGSKPLLSFLSQPKYVVAKNFLETRGPMILLILILADSFGGLGLFSGLFHIAYNFVTNLISF
ncbi:MAG: site-2 protease family protein [Patescibacteria group bacterium]